MSKKTGVSGLPGGVLPDELGASASTTPTAKVFALLELLSQRGSARLTDLAAELNLPKTTLHRITAQLEQLGYLQREPGDRRLTIAPRLSKLSADILGATLRLAPRHAILKGLAMGLGESCSLAIRVGYQVVYIDDVTAPSPLSFNFGTGQQTPLYCTSSGKLYLAHMSATELGRYLETEPLVAFTKNTITDPGRLRAQLAEIAEFGFASSHGELVVGVVGAAVPVRDSDGRMLASITTSIPAARMAFSDLPKLKPALVSAAEELAQTFAT